MFGAIKSFIRNSRIKIDYPRYEREQRVAHLAQADRRFDASQLDKEIAQIRQQATAAGDQRFGSDVASLRQRVAATEHGLRKDRQLLLIFERNYKAELDALYAQKTELFEEKEGLLADAQAMKAERSGAHDDLQEAYGDLEDAKSDVDRWYAKSERTPWLFGNGGKKLPRHSLFGQSHGDLSSAKYRRGEAVSDIGDSKRRIADIKARQAAVRHAIDRNYAEIGSVMEKIGSVKKDRQHMYDLKNEGVDPTVLRTTIKTTQSTLTDLERQLQSAENQRLALIQETQARMGLGEREAAVADLLSRKARFVEEFDSEQSRATRQDEHRRQWMASHA